MSNKNSPNNGSNKNLAGSSPKAISVAPRREIRSGERPAFQAPVPPKTK